MILHVVNILKCTHIVSLEKCGLMSSLMLIACIPTIKKSHILKVLVLSKFKASSHYTFIDWSVGKSIQELQISNQFVKLRPDLLTNKAVWEKWLISKDFGPNDVSLVFSKQTLVKQVVVLIMISPTLMVMAQWRPPRDPWWCGLWPCIWHASYYNVPTAAAVLDSFFGTKIFGNQSFFSHSLVGQQIRPQLNKLVGHL